MRCLKIAKYLRDYGWEPVIFTADNAHYPSIDESNAKDIPEGITILKQKIWEPYSLYKIFTGQKKDANVNNIFSVEEVELSFMHQVSIWIRSNFFIPDARAFWIKPSVKFLTKYLQENPVDAMFTDGPPHSNTRIANLLKNKLGIPWIADFQDPWTQVDFFKRLRLTKWGVRKHHRLEQEAFAAADRITIVSHSWKKDLESIGAKNVSVLPWGFDPDDFKNVSSAVDEKFTLSHLGILGMDRNPQKLFEVIKELAAELPNFKADFELNLYGLVGFAVMEDAKRIGVEEMIQLRGNVSRTEALARTASSNVLLLLLNKQDNILGRIPGKLFEYLAARRPILVLGPPESDVANIVREVERGESRDYDDKAGIKTIVRHYYQQYLTKKLAQPLDKDIRHYSSPVLTQQVAQLLDEITAAKQ